ncbi:hypothetical protein [Kribbella sp. NPDC051770]|uniref:hypothetical protein n=1 Tax=Kribbella sp. NPDC051770 TaxID=3155413 RepID=UPI003424E227
MPNSARWIITLLTAVVVFAATVGVGYAITDEFSPPVTALAGVLASAIVAIGAASVARQQRRDRRKPPPVQHQISGPVTGFDDAVVGNYTNGDLIIGSGGRRQRRGSGKKPSA